jgi:hypothetical protein
MAILLAAAAKGGAGHCGGLVVHDNNENDREKFESVNVGNVVAMFPAFW